MHKGWRFGSRRLAGNESGSFAVIAAVVSPLLVLAIGYSINVGQIFNVRSNLRAALDAAITSTARDITLGVIEPEQAEGRVKQWLEVNGDFRLSKADEIKLADFKIDTVAKTVESGAFVDVSLLFPVFGLPHTERVWTESGAIYSDKRVEVAMMLDITGSMAADKKAKTDKIGDLKLAASNAVKTMLDKQDPKNPRVRVSIVPYASGVNVGGLKDTLYAETSSSSNLPPVAGGSLLLAKTGSAALPSFSDYVSIVGTAFPRPDNCGTERKTKDGEPDLSSDGPDKVRTDKSGKQYFALVNRDDHMSGTGLNKCPAAQVVPLTTNSKTLQDSINAFEANGYTAGAIAIQWTYYMLSPGWRDVIKKASLGDGPSDHSSKKVSKVAILMTDGQFNTAFAG
ncbi:MAG: pilus assembly protein, partial [Rhizobiaceae bacterium]|nr:pilus assembly protein [Rhizobiaceae bacterium]